MKRERFKLEEIFKSKLDIKRDVFDYPEGYICNRLDYFSAMIHDFSINDVFCCLGMGESFGDDLERAYNERFIKDEVTHDTLIINLNHIVISVPHFDIYSLKEAILNSDESILFCYPFSTIKVDISGQGIEYLYQNQIDVDLILQDWNKNVEKLGGTTNITRCDFAFDLINLHPNFIVDFIEQSSQCVDPDSLRMFVGRKGGLKYSIRTGDQLTVYIGSGKSPRLLRMYDKKLQLSFSNTYSIDCPYRVNGELPSSWIRIELQTRRDQAENLLHNDRIDPHIYHDIFKEIGSYYAPRLPDGNTIECWSNVFITDAPSIILNIKNVVIVDFITQSVQSLYNRSLSSLYVLISNYGFDQFKKILEETFVNMQVSDRAGERRRINSIINKILISNDGMLPAHLIRDNNGIYRLKD